MDHVGRSALTSTLAVALLLTACNGLAPGATPLAPASTSAPKVKPRVSPAPDTPQTASRVDTLTRMVTQGVSRVITGKIKLISEAGGSLLSEQGGSLLSEQGGSLISPETGRILSNNSGSLISNAGGSVISNAGGNLIGKTKFFRLRSQTVVAEDLLGEALIEVLDAEGRVLVDEAGNPIQATSDASGRYSLQAALPDENVILRVKLNEKLAGVGAELKAMVVTKTLGASGSLDIDTSASLAANYVLSEYVKGQQMVFNRLPQDANRDLRNEVEKARAFLPVQVPSYQPETMARTLGELRGLAQPLDDTLERVKALLLLGQENLGEGLAATNVPLAMPIAVTRDALGNAYIAESVVGRIRKVNSNGQISVIAGGDSLADAVAGAQAVDSTFAVIGDLAVEPSGALLVLDTSAHRVWRIQTNGILQAVAGTGARSREGVDGPAVAAGLSDPQALAVKDDGTIYITDTLEKRAPGRLLEIAEDGVLRQVPLGIESFKEEIRAVAATPDGAVWVATPSEDGRIYRRAPGASSFTPVGSPLNAGWNPRLAPAPDGAVYFTESGGDRLLKIAADGTFTRLQGPGNPGDVRDEKDLFQSLEAEAATLRRPAGIAVLPNGLLWVVDSIHMSVRQVNPNQPDSPMPVVAGSIGITTLGEAQGIAVNGPAGLAVAPNGRELAFAETGGSVVKQLRDGQVSVIAGGRTGPWQDGGPALAAGLTAPSAIAYDPDGNLWIAELANARILKMEPDGTLRHRAGSGASLDPLKVNRFNPGDTPAREVLLGRPVAIAINPLDKSPCWVDQAFGVVCRLTPDDRIEVIAGALPATGDSGDAGDGGPAANARFNYPSGLAFDQAGNLYIADSLNFKVRKIAMQEPGRPIQTIAGLGMAGSLLSMVNNSTSVDTGPAKNQLLRLPAGLFVDKKNRLYVVEAGTSRLRALVKSMNAGFQLPENLPKLPARIRRLDLNQAEPVFTTIAGPGGRILTETRGDQTLGVPLGMTIDGSGQMIISDTLNNQIKLVPRAVLD